MTFRQQLQQDLQTLPLEALELVAEFVQLLKKSQANAPEPSPAGQPQKGSGAAILQFLQTHPLAPEHQRTAAEIDQYISEEQAVGLATELV